MQLRRSYARPDVDTAGIGCAPDPPKRMRFSAPFDPAAPRPHRAERLFDFRYRNRGFHARGQAHLWLYYVFPLLEGARLCRADRYEGVYRDEAVLRVAL